MDSRPQTPRRPTPPPPLATALVWMLLLGAVALAWIVRSYVEDRPETAGVVTREEV